MKHFKELEINIRNLLVVSLKIDWELDMQILKWNVTWKAKQLTPSSLNHPILSFMKILLKTYIRHPILYSHSNIEKGFQSEFHCAKVCKIARNFFWTAQNCGELRGFNMTRNCAQIKPSCEWNPNIEPQNLHAISNSAFSETVSPSLFLATHQ